MLSVSEKRTSFWKWEITGYTTYLQAMEPPSLRQWFPAEMATPEIQNWLRHEYLCYPY
ncbi:hypothetical protein J6590_057700 [Homalodisca vitripennis]|nr:hypothetical protein J6590_057700 [Homalodisca vitripennis]